MQAFQLVEGSSVSGLRAKVTAVLGVLLGCQLLLSCTGFSADVSSHASECLSVELYERGHWTGETRTRISLFDDGTISVGIDDQESNVRNVGKSLEHLCADLSRIPLEDYPTVLVPVAELDQLTAYSSYVVLRPRNGESVAYSRASPDFFGFDESTYAKRLRRLEWLVMQHFGRAYCIDPLCRYSRLLPRVLLDLR